MSKKLLPQFSIFFLLSFHLLFNIPTSVAKDKYYQLKTLWIREFSSVIPFDINNDGIDELAIQLGAQFDVNDVNLSDYSRSFRIAGTRKYSFTPLLPCSRDSIIFLASLYTPDSSVHKMLPPMDLTRGKSIAEDSLKPFITFYRPPQSSKYDFYQDLRMIGHFTNRRGEKITLFNIHTGWDVHGERGLLAANIYTRKRIWQTTFAPIVTNIDLDDIDGDGEVEIVVGTYANNNGLKVAGTTDDSCYVFVYEADGRLKWKRSIGPYWTGAWVGIGDFYGDGNKNIVVYQYSRRHTVTIQDFILILDAENGQTLTPAKRIGNRFTFALNIDLRICHDFNGDGEDEIVVGNTDGFVRLLNGDLTALNQSEPFHNKPIRVEAVADLDGDGLLEVICIIPNERIIILDHNLNTLYSWHLPTPTNVAVKVIRHINQSYLLVNLPEGTKRIFRLFKLEQSTIPFETISKTKKFTGWFALLLLVVLLIVLVRNLYFGVKARNMLPSLLTRANLMDRSLLITRNGNIFRIGRNWCDLLRLSPFTAEGSPWKSVFMPERLADFTHSLTAILEGQKTEYSLFFKPTDNESSMIPIKITSLYVAYVRMHCVMIFDMSEEEHIRQVKHWARVAQRLAHGIKNPLTAVKLNAEELRHLLKQKCDIDDLELNEYFDAMIGQVTRLKKMSDGFMRFVEFEKVELKPLNLNEEVRELIVQWLPEKSRRIRLEWDLDETIPQTMLDRYQFEYALKNVFFNAIESISSGGRILISTRNVQLLLDEATPLAASIFNELQIQDTGCGIPPEFLDKVMLPYFTRNKRDGTGLGLSIVQKIMDSHRGQFDIKSEVGVGTTITMRFRVSVV